MVAVRSPYLLIFMPSFWLCYSLLATLHLPYGTSLSFNFDLSQADGYNAANFSFQGDAYLHPQAIELTSNKNSVGRVSYPIPVTIWDDISGELASFTSTFSFQIRGVTGGGMAFFLGHYPSSIPSMSFSGGLGLMSMDASKTGQIVAIEFDTSLDPDFDTSDNHMGIDIGTLVSKVYTNTTVRDNTLTSGLVMTCNISYDNSTQSFSADLLIGGTSYQVETIADLRQQLPSLVAIGFSAANGMDEDQHRILSWSFNSTLDGSRHAPAPAPAPHGRRHQQSKSKSKHPKIIIEEIVGVALGLISLIACLTCTALLVLRLCRLKMKKYYETPAHVPRRFSYRQLANATNNFAEECKLGEGGYAIVYRGELRNSRRSVAVKKFKPGTCSSLGRRAFEDEIKVISQVRHRNLVELVGWCNDGKTHRLLLVYELVSEGSLNEHLHEGRSWLSWPTRYKIVLQLGCALHYLHAECKDCIIHGDIKPCNILLDPQYVAMLADFGLARLVNHENQLQTTSNVAGTIGYVDPEFVCTGKRRKESDVYSFGIVLLEIASGRRPGCINHDTTMVTPLLKWVWGFYDRNAILEAADATLRDESNEEDRNQMQRVLLVGLWCAHPDASQRPSIEEAVTTLKGRGHILEITHLPLHTAIPRPLSLTTIEIVSGSSDGGLPSNAGRADENSYDITSLC